MKTEVERMWKKAAKV